jgi:hypothetical protein
MEQLLTVWSFQRDPQDCKAYLADEQQALDFVREVLRLGGGPLTITREQMSRVTYEALHDESAEADR